MRNVILSLILLAISLPSFSQQETGDLVLEFAFDDYVEAEFTIQGSYIIDFGIFDGIGYEDSAGWEFSIDGGSTSPFDAQMLRNFDYESTADTIWRLQYRVWAESSPFHITSSLRSTDSPYLGMFYSFIIPEGFEREWILIDYSFGPGSFYDATRSSLQLRMGNQPEQTLHIDDIRLYDSRALAASAGYNLTEDKELNFFDGYQPPAGVSNPYNNSFELPVDNTFLACASGERILETNAPDGVRFFRASVTDPGSNMADAFVSIQCRNDSQYTGAYRLNLSVRSNIAPLQLHGGLANNPELNDLVRTSSETVAIENPDTWSRISFPVASGNFTGNDIYPFLQFGGQGEAMVDIDRVFILKTDEAIVPVSEWGLY